MNATLATTAGALALFVVAVVLALVAQVQVVALFAQLVP